VISCWVGGAAVSLIVSINSGTSGVGMNIASRHSAICSQRIAHTDARYHALYSEFCPHHASLPKGINR
jgi:hypothetical protein